MNDLTGNRIHFIGIGGIGMSALALFFQAKGNTISGYDKTPSPITDALIAQGINVYFESNPDIINNDLDIVIYTPAIPQNDQELAKAQKSEVAIYKRSEVLAKLTEKMFTIAVAGTHGKTTITAMISHLLKSAGLDINAFIGGVTANYNSNVLIGKSNIMVVEADEFDRSFHHLKPNLAVISAVDPDHLDIYENAENFSAAYTEFAGKVNEEGKLLVHDKCAGLFSNISSETYSYGHSDKADYKLIVKEGQVFEISAFDNLQLKPSYPGQHNQENFVAAAMIASWMGLTKDEIKAGIESFKGIKRRMEVHVKGGEYVYIDDYAHHPTEIKAVAESVKALFPEESISAAFQPHLFTRTRDFAQGFADSLDLFDKVYLMEIYPAREEPIEGVDSSMLQNLMSKAQVVRVNKSNFLDSLKVSPPHIFLTLGAGDIDRFVPEVKELYLELNHKA